eukprot:10488307-Alexandrium_andersonii.AAC.1
MPPPSTLCNPSCCMTKSQAVRGPQECAQTRCQRGSRSRRSATCRGPHLWIMRSRKELRRLATW